MSYEMTPEEAAKYGAGLSIWDQLRLLQSWAPLIGYGQRFVNEIDPHRRALVVADACEWLAAKTSSPLDDQLVRHIGDVLKTKEGEALVRWCLLQVEGAK
jgi:hypothetical protein